MHASINFLRSVLLISVKDRKPPTLSLNPDLLTLCLAVIPNVWRSFRKKRGKEKASFIFHKKLIVFNFFFEEQEEEEEEMHEDLEA